MRKGLLYIHGKGGGPGEAEHYRALFPGYEVAGLDYRSQTPWEAREEFPRLYDSFGAEHQRIVLVANSIGAFLSMHALSDKPIARAYFISPIVDMEQLIGDMMRGAGVTERELQEKGEVGTAFGETLSWAYLQWVREHPLAWRVPTAILHGAGDNLQSMDTVQSFAARTGADLTVMKNGGHWFHTAEETRFLDEWIQRPFPVLTDSGTASGKGTAYEIP